MNIEQTLNRLEVRFKDCGQLSKIEIDWMIEQIKQQQKMISFKELKLIGHAIGLRHFKAPRNFFSSGEYKNDSWERLCEIGLARGMNHGSSRGGHIYFVSESLFKILECEERK
jgi:hypothetical protein